MSQISRELERVYDEDLDEMDGLITVGDSEDPAFGSTGLQTWSLCGDRFQLQYYGRSPCEHH